MVTRTKAPHKLAGPPAENRRPMSRAKRRRPRRADRPGEKPSPSPGPSPQSLAALVSLAGLSALWALFQWTELVVSRTGGESFCGFGGSDRCAQLWDSSVASAVRAWTALPVAAWGVVWSLVAFAFPLWTLVRRSQRLARESNAAQSDRLGRRTTRGARPGRG